MSQALNPRANRCHLADLLRGGATVRDKLGMLTLEQARALPDAETGCGVYFLWFKDELQYVGASKNINGRVHIHWCSLRYGNQGGGYKQRIPFDRVTVLETSREEMRALERAYIAHFSPPYNIQSRKS